MVTSFLKSLSKMLKQTLQGGLMRTILPPTLLLGKRAVSTLTGELEGVFTVLLPPLGGPIIKGFKLPGGPVHSRTGEAAKAQVKKGWETRTGRWNPWPSRFPMR